MSSSDEWPQGKRRSRYFVATEWPAFGQWSHGSVTGYYIRSAVDQQLEIAPKGVNIN